jgi:uncharacterized protein YkwD
MHNYPHTRAAITTLCLTLLAFNSFGQTQNSKLKSSIAQQPALTVATIPPGQYEQQLLEEINSARKNPAAYVSYLVEYRAYYHDKAVTFPDGRTIETNEGVAALDEAIAFVRSLKPVGPLEVRRGMMSGAKLHLEDMKKSGRFGHIGSNGSKPEDRLNLFGTWEASVGENLVYESRSARNDVIGMLIDDGVTTRGHRKNIFKPEFRVIGIALDPPAKERTMAVITFAGGFIDKVETKPSAARQY